MNLVGKDKNCENLCVKRQKMCVIQKWNLQMEFSVAERLLQNFVIYYCCNTGKKLFAGN